MSDIHHVGFLYDDSGDPIVGATVQAYEKNTTTTAGSSVTTDSNGKWTITTTSDNELDIKITSGSSVRYRKFDDAIQVNEIEVSTFNIREGATAQVYTIAPGSITADRTLTLPAATGNDTLASLGLAQTFTANQTFSAGITSTASGNTLGATSFNDAAITNVGDIALDSISADGTDINVAVSDNSATAFTIKQGSDAYLVVDTANSSESVSIGTGISGTAITIGHSTSETTVADNLTVTGNLTVNGTTTTVNSTTTTVDDPIFTLGGDTAPGSDDNKDRGIEFRYHDGSCARIGFFGYDDSASVFTGFTAATNSSEVFSGTVINAKFGSLNLGTVAAAGTDTDKFLVLDSCGNVDYRTGAQVLSDIGGSGGSTVTVTDNESTNENNLVTFVADAGTSTGSHGLEMDGNFHYNPSTGLVTATGFSGNLTGTLQTAAQGNVTSLGTLTALTVDDVAVDGKVVTMTGSACDTVVMTAATNGAFSLVTTDAAAAAANIQITADGTVDIDSAGVLTLDSGAAINLEPAAGSAVLIDGTVSIDGAAITGATSILATDIKIGEDDQTKVDFACANIINLHANNIKAASIHNTSSKGDLRLYEGCNYVSITTPCLSGNWTLTLPANDGNCGQVLTTNGSGVASWACASGGGGVVSGGTDNAILRADGTGGSTSQGSAVTIADTTGDITLPAAGQILTGTGGACNPGLSFRGDCNTGFFRPASDKLAVSIAAYERMRWDGSTTYILDTANGDMAAGLTIGQEDNDNALLAFKSSDVAHGQCGAYETDTFGLFKKLSAASGGMRQVALSEASYKTAWAVEARIGTACTGNTACSQAAIAFMAVKKDGSGGQNLGSCDNIASFHITNSESGYGVLLVKGNGDIHSATGSVTNEWDAYCDVALLTAARAIQHDEGTDFRNRYAQWIDDYGCILEETKVISRNLDTGGPAFVSHNGMMGLTVDAIRQLGERIVTLETQLQALSEGK